MSKDEYPSIFLLQMEAIVFIILQIFFATREVLKIGVYSWIYPSIRSRDAFRPIARNMTSPSTNQNVQFLHSPLEVILNIIITQ